MGNSNSAPGSPPLVLTATQKKEILDWITKDNVVHNKFQPPERVCSDTYWKSEDFYTVSGRFISDDVCRRIVRKMKYGSWNCSYTSIASSVGVSPEDFSEWRNYPGRCFEIGISIIGWLREIERNTESEYLSLSVASAPRFT